MAEELPVASSNHRPTVPDEIHGVVAQRGSPPRIGGDRSGAVDGLSDLAIVRTVSAAVSGAEHVLESASLLRGQALILRYRQPMQGAIEPGERLDAVEAIAVERDQGGEW